MTVYGWELELKFQKLVSISTTNRHLPKLIPFFNINDKTLDQNQNM